MNQAELSCIEDLLKAHCNTRYRKVLLCAQDVADAILTRARPAPPLMPWDPDLSSLTGIEVTPVSHYRPGQWKLVRHDNCAITGGPDGTPGSEHYALIVSHEGCTVLDGSDGGPDGQ